MGDMLATPQSAAKADFARLIDHTLLKAYATAADIDRLCDEALKYNFWGVCVAPVHVREASIRLECSNVRVCAAVSYPLGSSTTMVKLTEAKKAIDDGARELDMVSNIGALKSGDSEAFFADIGEVASYSRSSNTILKVILECCYLSDEEKVKGARLAEQAGANFVKTSTGFGPGGATTADVALLRRTLHRKTGVKAAGGIGSLGLALQMRRAGADRIGTSSGVRIMEELLRNGG